MRFSSPADVAYMMAAITDAIIAIIPVTDNKKNKMFIPTLEIGGASLITPAWATFIMSISGSRNSNEQSSKK